MAVTMAAAAVMVGIAGCSGSDSSDDHGDHGDATIQFCSGTHFSGGTYYLKVELDPGLTDGPCSTLTSMTAAEFDRLDLTQQCSLRQDSPPRTLIYFSAPEPASVTAAQGMCTA